MSVSLLVIERRMGEELLIFLVARQRFVLVVMMHDFLKGQVDGEYVRREDWGRVQTEVLRGLA